MATATARKPAPSLPEPTNTENPTWTLSVCTVSKLALPRYVQMQFDADRVLHEFRLDIQKSADTLCAELAAEVELFQAHSEVWRRYVKTNDEFSAVRAGAGEVADAVRNAQFDIGTADDDAALASAETRLTSAQRRLRLLENRRVKLQDVLTKTKAAAELAFAEHMRARRVALRSQAWQDHEDHRRAFAECVATHLKPLLAAAETCNRLSRPLLAEAVLDAK